jgi:hypothetical protein
MLCCRNYRVSYSCLSPPLPHYRSALFALGLTSTLNPKVFLPIGYLLLGVGGTSVNLPLIQFANLFPKQRLLVVSIYVGAFSISGLVFQLFFALHAEGVAGSFSK